MHDCILVGKNTVTEDDPELTARLFKGKNPVRIILDTNCEISLMARVLDGAAETIIVTSNELSASKRDRLDALKNLPKIEVLELPTTNGKLSITALLEALASRNLTSILVEGGSQVHGAFFDLGYVDRIYAFVAPKLCGGIKALTPIGGIGIDYMSDSFELKQIETLPLGKDILITGIVERK